MTNPASNFEDFFPPDNDVAAVARTLFRMDPEAHCRAFGIPVTENPTLLPTANLPGDILVMRIGKRRLVHIEYVLDATDGMACLMMLYALAIKRAYPEDALSQHIIVLGDGTFDLPGLG
jgi:hypothetical protein